MHKNSQKRYYIRGAVYFITTVTKERYKYFCEEIFVHVLVEQIHFAQQLLQFQLYAYAIMPDHVHVLIQPHDTYNYSKIMFSIKKQFSHNANRVMGYNPFPDDKNDENIIQLQYYRDNFLKNIPHHVRIHHLYGKNRFMIILYGIIMIFIITLGIFYIKIKNMAPTASFGLNK